MGGKGSGGSRVGSGKKPKNQRLGELQGSRRTRARARSRNQNGVPPNQNATPNQNGRAPAGPGGETPAPLGPEAHIPPPPGNLTLDELAIWNELAPLAHLEGTLTAGTAFALRDLCEAMVLKRKLLRQVGDDGVTVVTFKGDRAAHPLLTQFRGLMQRVEAAMLRFKLSPMGKEIPQPGNEPADPFAEFDTTPAGKLGSTAH